MPDPLTIATGVSLGVQEAGRISSLLGRRSAESRRRRHLRRTAREGSISPRQEALILGRIGRTSGGVAARRTADTRGRLAALGLDRSVAGVSALDAPNRDAQRDLAEARTDIELTNEQARSAAEEALASEPRTSRLDVILGGATELASGTLKLAQQRNAVIAQRDAAKLADLQADAQNRRARAAELTAESLGKLRGAEQQRIEQEIARNEELQRAFGHIDPGDLVRAVTTVLGDPDADQERVDYIMAALQVLMGNTSQ